MASFTKWQAKLIQAVLDNDTDTIKYCKKIFPKDKEGNLTSLFYDTVTSGKAKLENKTSKKAPKTTNNTTNTRRRTKKKNEPTE